MKKVLETAGRIQIIAALFKKGLKFQISNLIGLWLRCRVSQCPHYGTGVEAANQLTTSKCSYREGGLQKRTRTQEDQRLSSSTADCVDRQHCKGSTQSLVYESLCNSWRKSWRISGYPSSHHHARWGMKLLYLLEMRVTWKYCWKMVSTKGWF